MTAQMFYGWFEDASQARDQPTVDAPHDGPCLYCGKAIDAENDVRSFSIMPLTYARRSYFYRTHRTCDEANKAVPHPVNLDDVIFAMIARNGD